MRQCQKIRETVKRIGYAMLEETKEENEVDATVVDSWAIDLLEVIGEVKVRELQVVGGKP